MSVVGDLSSEEVPVEAVTHDPEGAVPLPKLVSGEAVDEKPAQEEAAFEAAPAVQSDLHCPLLVDGAHIDRRTVVENIFGTAKEIVGKIIHRQPEQQVEHPVKCPSCMKVVESHMLCTDAHGNRDCAIALNARNNPKYARLFAAIAARDNAAIRLESDGYDVEARRIAMVFAPEAFTEKADG